MVRGTYTQALRQSRRARDSVKAHAILTSDAAGLPITQSSRWRAARLGAPSKPTSEPIFRRPTPEPVGFGLRGTRSAHLDLRTVRRSGRRSLVEVSERWRCVGATDHQPCGWA